MATKFLDEGGGTDTYTTWASWISYVQALSGLSSPEIVEIASAGEFNGGNAQLTGGTVSATSVNRIIIRPSTGKKWSGNLAYGSGARTLFDGASENMFINWDHVLVSGIQIKKTGASTTTGLGAISITTHLTVNFNDLLIDNRIGTVSCIDDRASANLTRSNVIVIMPSASQDTIGFRASDSTKNKIYVNCAAIAAAGGTNSGIAFHRPYSVPTWINCYAMGPWRVDYTSGYSTNSKFNATSKTAGGTGESTPSSGAVYGLTSAAFNSTNFASPDFRVASGGALHNAGVNAGGSTTDIYDQVIDGSARDIGPHEFQSAGGGGGGAVRRTYVYNPLGNLTVDFRRIG